MLGVKVTYAGDVSAYSINPNRGIGKYAPKKGVKRQVNYRLNVKKIRAAVAYQVDRSKRILFVCLTLSDTLKHTHSQVNDAFNLFIQNQKNNYGLQSYIAVAERQRNGSIHYHCLFKYGKENVNFTTINNAWCAAISTAFNINYHYHNAVRFGGYNKKTKRRYYYIYDAQGAVRYITKYLHKDSKKGYDARCYFMSRELGDVSVSYRGKVAWELLQHLRLLGCNFFSNDFCTTFNVQVADVRELFELDISEYLCLT